MNGRGFDRATESVAEKMGNLKCGNVKPLESLDHMWFVISVVLFTPALSA